MYCTAGENCQCHLLSTATQIHPRFTLLIRYKTLLDGRLPMRGCRADRRWARRCSAIAKEVERKHLPRNLGRSGPYHSMAALLRTLVCKDAQQTRRDAEHESDLDEECDSSLALNQDQMQKAATNISRIYIRLFRQAQAGAQGVAVHTHPGRGHSGLPQQHCHVDKLLSG